MPKQSLKELRTKVQRARMKEKQHLEKKKLKRELFELENPRLVSAGKATFSGAKALGRGLSNIQLEPGEFSNRDRTKKIKKSFKKRSRRKPMMENDFENPLTGGLDFGF